MVASKILSLKERLDAALCFAVIDATIATYGAALLDCGHETDGRRIAHYVSKSGIGVVTCHKCADGYFKNEPQIIDEIRKEECKCEVPCKACTHSTHKGREN